MILFLLLAVAITSSICFPYQERRHEIRAVKTTPLKILVGVIIGFGALIGSVAAFEPLTNSGIITKYNTLLTIGLFCLSALQFIYFKKRVTIAKHKIYIIILSLFTPLLLILGLIVEHRIPDYAICVSWELILLTTGMSAMAVCYEPKENI